MPVYTANQKASNALLPGNACGFHIFRPKTEWIAKEVEMIQWIFPFRVNIAAYFFSSLRAGSLVRVRGNFGRRSRQCTRKVWLFARRPPKWLLVGYHSKTLHNFWITGRHVHHGTLTGNIKKTCLIKFREEQLAPYLFNWIAESKSSLFLLSFFFISWLWFEISHLISSCNRPIYITSNTRPFS